MTTQPFPATDNRIPLDTLPPEDAAYLERIGHALRCGVPGCECATGPTLHCPTHPSPIVPTLSVSYDEGAGFSFECTRCPSGKVWEALAKRGLMPLSRLYTSTGAVEAGLDPFAFFIQQPTDWLWPNRIPLGKLTLIAGYPSSGKTAIALDVAARVSRGAAAPDQPDARFPAAPVVLVSLNGNPKADVLPTLRLFGADLDFIYLADLLSPTHRLDYYPDDPPQKRDDEEDDDWGKGYHDYEDEDHDLRGTPLGRPSTVTGKPRMFPLFGEPDAPAPKLAAPWPGLSHVMGRLANYIEAGSAALLVVDQVEDLAAMHRAHVTTVLGMLKALAARSGAAVVALTHNPASNYPRAVTAMQNRLAQAPVVFTTALMGPGGRRFLVPLRPAMSDDAPAIPFALPPAEAFTVAWRKPVFPAHMNALAAPRPNDGAKTRAARALLMRALADGPRPAAEVEREAAMHGIAKRTLRRARLACNIKAARVGAPSGPGAGTWQWSLPPRDTLQQDETPHAR